VHSEPDPLEDILGAQQQQVLEARRRLEHLRTAIAGGASRDQPALEPFEVPPADEYAALAAASRQYLASVGRSDLDLEDLLEPHDLNMLRSDAQRLGWTASDAAAVGLCGLAGGITAVLAGAIDSAVMDHLGLVERSQLISRWKRETTHLPIDYNGAAVGGPGHRVTSAGHDIGRPVAAVRQIVEGTYKGTGWLYGERVPRVAHGTPTGTPYDVTPDVRVALALWIKHLITDVVTPTSLPLPGWTALYERAPTEELAEFLKGMYWSRGAGPGWNLRSVTITKTVPLVVVEVGIRSKVGWDSWIQRGSLRATGPEGAKRDEMLLATNGFVAAVTTGQAVIECLTTSSPLGLRSLNPQALVRTAQLGMKVVRTQRAARSTVPSWEELAAQSLAQDGHRLGTYTI
jgi:hypothetical protein